MTNNQDIDALKRLILGPRRVTTDSGTVEERSVDELKKGLDLLKKQQAALNDDGTPKPQLSRLGIYGRYNF